MLENREKSDLIDLSLLEEPSIEHSPSISRLLKTPSCYISLREKWELFCEFLSLFGVIYDREQEVIYLYWNKIEKSQLNIILQMMSHLLGDITLTAMYLKGKNCWKISLG
jgi:hypothetical protein